MPDPILYGKGRCCRIHIDTQEWPRSETRVAYKKGQTFLSIQFEHSWFCSILNKCFPISMNKTLNEYFGLEFE